MDIIKARKFYDRDEILGLLLDDTRNLIATNDYKKIVALWGVSGSGKSGIIDELIVRLNSKKYINYKDVKKLNIFKVDLEDRFTPAKILYRIRENLDFSCVQFDYAFLVWWNKTSNMSVIDNAYYNHTQNSFIELISSIGIPYVSSFFGILDVWNKNKPKIKSSLLLSEDEYNFLRELDNKSEKEVLFHLPTLLGRDISKKLGKKKNIFLIDSFIEMINRENRKWVLKFFDEIPNILMVITSKERLLSFSKNKLTRFEERQIEGLPEPFSNELLSDNIKNISQEACKKIYDFTDGLPRCLKLVVSGVQQGNLTINEKDIFYMENMDEFMIALFNHLSIPVISTIKALSIINFFDDDALSFFSYKKGEILPLEERNLFIQSSLLKQCSDNLEVLPKFKLLDIVVKCLQCQMDTEEFILNLHVCRDYIYSRFYKLSIDTKLAILFNIENSIELKSDILTNTEGIDLLIDIFILFAEYGYYNEVHEFLNSALSSEQKNNEFYFIIDGVCISKITGSADALKCYSQITESQRKKLKRHYKTLQLLEAYSNALCGNYEAAFTDFKSVYESTGKEEYNYWHYVKSKIYYADMLILQGSFTEALSIFFELKNELSNSDSKYFDYYEIEKQIGHCYRFNFLLDNAEIIYEKGYRETNKNSIISLRNYFLTTVLETTCYANYEKFESYIHQGTKYNILSGHKNNIAKILYAHGIYNIHLKKFQLSKRYINQSIKLNVKSNYISGQLFGYIALAYLEYAESGSISDKTFDKINEIINGINVYHFLLVPLYVIKNDSDKLSELENKYKWIDFDTTITNIKSFINQLR